MLQDKYSNIRICVALIPCIKYPPGTLSCKALASSPDSPLRAMLIRDLCVERKIRTSRGPGNEANKVHDIINNKCTKGVWLYERDFRPEKFLVRLASSVNVHARTWNMILVHVTRQLWHCPRLTLN